MKVSLYKIFPLLPNKKESFYALLWGKLEKITQEIAIFLSFSPQKTDRLYRWDADYDRPINRPFFSPIIGRLIGIGRTLLLCNSRNLKLSWQINLKDDKISRTPAVPGRGVLVLAGGSLGSPSSN